MGVVDLTPPAPGGYDATRGAIDPTPPPPPGGDDAARGGPPSGDGSAQATDPPLGVAAMRGRPDKGALFLFAIRL